MKRALITGHAGFVGRHMLSKLSGDNWEVTGIDESHGLDARTYIRHSDRVYDLIIHAAAAGPNRAAIDSEPLNFPYNVQLDAAMIEWAARTKQRHFVYLSSSAVYPATLQNEAFIAQTHDKRLRETETDAYGTDPADVYGFTKIIGEQMIQSAQKYGLSATVVRPFSGYGTDQSEDFPFRAFVERARRRENPFKIWGSEHQVRDFIHIDDICSAIMVLVEANTSQPVNLCTGVGTTLGELGDRVTTAFGYNPYLEVDDTAPMGVFYRVGNPNRLHEFYEPKISLEEGIDRAVRGV